MAQYQISVDSQLLHQLFSGSLDSSTNAGRDLAAVSDTLHAQHYHQKYHDHLNRRYV